MWRSAAFGRQPSVFGWCRFAACRLEKGKTTREDTRVTEDDVTQHVDVMFGLVEAFSRFMGPGAWGKAGAIYHRVVVLFEIGALSRSGVMIEERCVVDRDFGAVTRML